MGGLLTSLAGPLVQGVKDIIGQFVQSPEQKAQITEALAKLESDFQLKVMEADVQFAQAQASVVGKEADSTSWLARNWRPILMLTFTYIVAHTFVFAPLFSLHAVLIPEQMWELLKIGMGGYIFGRSAEKVVPDVVKALKK